MFKTLENIFEHSSINVTLTLRNQLLNKKMTKSENIASHIEESTVKYEDGEVREYCLIFHEDHQTLGQAKV